MQPVSYTFPYPTIIGLNDLGSHMLLVFLYFFFVFEAKTNKKVQVHTPLCCYGALCGGFYLKIDLCSEFFFYISERVMRKTNVYLN